MQLKLEAEKVETIKLEAEMQLKLEADTAEVRSKLILEAMNLRHRVENQTGSLMLVNMFAWYHHSTKQKLINISNILKK